MNTGLDRRQEKTKTHIYVKMDGRSKIKEIAGFAGNTQLFITQWRRMVRRIT